MARPTSTDDLERRADAARLTGCAEYEDPLDCARGIVMGLAISVALLTLALALIVGALA